MHDLIFNAVLIDNSMFRMIRILKYFLVVKTLVASAIGTHMDEKKGIFLLQHLTPDKFSVSAFSIQSYWKGAAAAGPFGIL